jgi:hypothetical protein
MSEDYLFPCQRRKEFITGKGARERKQARVRERGRKWGNYVTYGISESLG